MFIKEREFKVLWNSRAKTRHQSAMDGTAMVPKDWLEHELDLPSPYSVIFQRVHRLGRVQPNCKPRPIIALFLNYLDDEEIFELRKKLPEGTEFNVRRDLPKTVLDIRKNLIPKLVEARDSGETAFFSKAEPYRLFIDESANTWTLLWLWMPCLLH